MPKPLDDRVVDLQRQLIETQDDTERAHIHLELGRIAMGEGRLDAAVRHFREALLLDRRLEQARRLLGELGEVSRINIDKVRSRRLAVRNFIDRLRR